MQKASLISPARIFFYILSLVIFFLVIRYAGKMTAIRDLLFQMRPAWLLVAVAAQAGTYLLNVLILRTLLKGHTGNIRFGTLLKISVVILFINQALPSGGISGNGYLFKQLVKRKVPPRSAFNGLILETLAYYLAFLGLLGGFYGWYALHVRFISPVIPYTVITGFVFFICLGTLILIISNRRAISFLLPKLNRIRWLRRYIAQNNLLSLSKGRRTNWQDLFRDKQAVLLAILFQAAILCCDAVTVFAILHGFHTPLAPASIMFGLLLSLVIGSLPVSPGALIAYESAMTYFYTLLGVPVHAALTVTLLFRFFSFWLPIPLGLALYRHLRHH